jgi:hypothetical protein
MRDAYVEDPANHDGPSDALVFRDGVSQALAAVRGLAIEPRNA